MPNFLFRCPNGHENELLRHRDTVEVPCACGEFADFKEASAEVDYHYTKAEDSGMPVKRPNLFQTGLAKARKMGVKI
jgi:hypothetical protein